MRKMLIIVGLMISVGVSGQWSELGGVNSLKANSGIYAMCNDKFGNVYAAGWFDNNTSNGLFIYVAKWDKATDTWSELGGHNSLHGISGLYALCCDTFGNVYAGGVNYAAWGVGSGQHRLLAKWDKTTNTWSDLVNSSHMPSNSISSLCSDEEGNIYSGAGYNYWLSNTQIYNIGKCDKATNTWVKSGINDTSILKFNVNAMTIDRLGNVYAVGQNYQPVSTYPYVAKLDKATNTWSKLGGAVSLNGGTLYSIAVDTFGNVYTGGYLLDDSNKSYVAKWDGTQWSVLGGPNSIGISSNNIITSIIVNSSGVVYASGRLQDSAGYCFVAKWDGIKWSKLGGDSLSANGQINSLLFDETTNVIYAAGNFKNFNGNYFVAKYISNIPLPLKLLSFSAQKESNNVLLNWQTANEVNVSHFNVQRSTNDKDFITIGKVAAQNKNSNEYTFYDSPPVEGLGVVYYRIESIDFDGKKQYSEIRTLNIKPQTLKGVGISPNPAKTNVTVTSKGIRQIEIFDIMGKKVMVKELNNLDKINIDISKLNKGLFLVRITGLDGETNTSKLVIE